jgi:CRISPR/Cas system CMR-associated protein Cmr3 (group 5 of RAMP superfamily)
LVTLGGKWIRLHDLTSDEESLEIFEANEFYQTESRTGIALLRNKRTVREGHLYSFPFIRLKEVEEKWK